jgi:hypothetical protein
MNPEERVALALYRYRLEGQGQQRLPDELPKDGPLRERMLMEATLAIAVYRNALRLEEEAARKAQGDLPAGAR